MVIPLISDHIRRRYRVSFERSASGLEYDRALSSLPLIVTSSGSGEWNAGRFFKRSRSEIFGLELVVAGDASFTQNNREYVINPGEVYILRKGSNHIYQTGPGRFLLKRFINLEGPVLDHILQAVGLQSYDVVHPLDAQFIRKKFKQIDILLTEKPPAFAAVASAAAYELLIELGKSVRPQLPVPVRSALEFMQRNLHKNLGSPDFARAAGLSMTHFNRLFARHMGTSPKAYFNARRMEWAQYLLRSTRVSIKQIALNVGFEDPFYFSARFKHVMGNSPRESRNK